MPLTSPARRTIATPGCVLATMMGLDAMGHQVAGKRSTGWIACPPTR